MRKIEALEQMLKSRFPKASVVIDAPDVSSHPWWLDATVEGQQFTVEWRPRKGFGLSSTEAAGFGEGPDEIHPTAEAVFDRIVSLVETGQKTQPPPDVLLKRLREIRHLSQEDIAQRLQISQSSVSKIERNSDMYISTLRRLLEAIGGTLEIRARFPDMTVNIVQFDQLSTISDKDRGRKRSRRSRTSAGPQRGRD